MLSYEMMATGSDAKQINILIVDDQVLFAENLKLMLETLTSDIRCIDIAFNGQEAIDKLEKISPPDIILLDVRMPVMDGVQAARIIKKRWPDIKIVMLTTFIDDEYVREAIEYGATGYFIKNIKPQDLVSALRTIAVNDSSIILPENWVSTYFSQKNNSDWDNFMSRLGNREKEVLQLISKGYNNKRIAEELFISEPTVRNYISRIYAKIGSKDRLEVISIVRQNKI